MATILTIDQGSSSTKCLLVNERVETVARGSCPLSEQHPRPGWVEHSAEEVFASVQGAVRACLAGQEVREVVAVGISNQRESLVAWDAQTGAPLAPMVSWQDQRTAADCDALRSDANERLILEQSGLPLDPMFSAAKARWLLDALDKDRSRSRAGAIRLGTVDSWLLSRFGSQHVIEAGNASRTQLLDVRKASWSPELLELFGIPRRALPEIVSSRGPFPAVRGLSPLPDGVPVFAVMGDSHSALFAHGVFAPGRVKATFGTGSSVMGLVEKPEALSRGLCLTIGWALDRPAFAAEGNIRSTGQTLRFVADLFGMTPQEVADLAAKESSQGVVIVPGFNGLGAPYWDRNAVGLITNLTLGAGRGAVARAALESVPHQICNLIESIDATSGRVSENPGGRWTDEERGADAAHGRSFGAQGCALADRGALGHGGGAHGGPGGEALDDGGAREARARPRGVRAPDGGGEAAPRTAALERGGGAGARPRLGAANLPFLGKGTAARARGEVRGAFWRKPARWAQGRRRALLGRASSRGASIVADWWQGSGRPLGRSQGCGCESNPVFARWPTLA